ncbi:helix-turn-helix domain-containing protein [Paenibacillus doosanensis]|uniref:helix-turn-helix domain-containing protein n=1 Tax=Paenibacillus doosanensis TaxID=1229154 RepID=UPI00217FCAE7|nr:helix-turn-helix domain-containing protein [Paenibacillus doosanensis]MCS7462058.1 helix-turn-helix domain-containing protein [Paenibacillus doosanensis]
MYKVFLVEDEWLVLQGLKLTIPWEELNCEIIGEASDGRTGAELILTAKPDIVLTDIRMPAMDGIQLAEQAAAGLPGIKIVFLTGFDDFAYAQKAVKLGAADFVLKPTNADELIQVIGRITSQLDTERSRRSFQERLEHRAKLEHPLIMEKMLYELMQDYAGPTLKELFLEYGEWSEAGAEGDGFPPYRLLLIQLDGLCRESAERERQLEQVREQAQELSALPVVRMSENRYALIANRRTGREALMESAAALLRRLPVLTRSYVIGVSALFTAGIESLPAAYQQAMRALYQTVFLGRETWIWYEDIEREQADEPGSEDAVQEWIDLVKWGHAASIEAHTAAWYSRLLHRYPDGLEARRRFFEFIVALYSALLRDHELREIVLGSDFLLAFAERLEHTLERSLELLRAMLAEWNGLLAEQGETRKKSGFEEIEAFIQSHYAEDITLQGIAERYHMSESYFSRLFKKQVGTSFLEYVTMIRVRQAKELLANPRLKIYEVSLQAGYQDSRYFSQIFRKYTGETPTEFRKRLGIEPLPL